VGIGYGTCQRVLTKKLGVHRVATKFVPKILTADQKHPAIPRKAQNGFHPPLTVRTDLAPCDFFRFPKIKLKLKGRRFDTTEEIQAESQRGLETLTEKDFQEAFQKSRRRWDRCLHAGGNYFEGYDGRQALW
jgi:hypothetical protein